MKHVVRQEEEKPDGVVEWWVEMEDDVPVLLCWRKDACAAPWRVLRVIDGGVELQDGITKDDDDCGLKLEDGFVEVTKRDDD
jgi:hypothetical protein